MNDILDKYESMFLNQNDDKYIIYRVPIEEICESCGKTIRDIVKEDTSGYKVLIEFIDKKEDKPYPKIKQININKVMF